MTSFQWKIMVQYLSTLNEGLSKKLEQENSFITVQLTFILYFTDEELQKLIEEQDTANQRLTNRRPTVSQH